MAVVADLSARGHPQHLTCTAVLGDVTAFRCAVWALAVQREVPYAAEVVVTADGAAWRRRLPPAIPLTRRAHRVSPNERHPFLGQTWVMVADLRAHDLAEQAPYFQIHQRRMPYREFRGAGYPIGPGTVASGITQFKHHLTAAGRRWSRPGAEHIITLRTLSCPTSLMPYGMLLDLAPKPGCPPTCQAGRQRGGGALQ